MAKLTMDDLVEKIESKFTDSEIDGIRIRACQIDHFQQASCHSFKASEDVSMDTVRVSFKMTIYLVESLLLLT